jgi:hypothetical protein
VDLLHRERENPALLAHARDFVATLKAGTRVTTNEDPGTGKERTAA